MQKFFYLLSKLFSLYSTLIFIRLILSWIPQRPIYDQYGRPVPQERPVYDFLCKITDWYLGLFRKKKLQVGSIDYSPLLGFMVLNILSSICTIVAQTGRITVFIVIAVILNGMWRYLFSYVFVLLLIFLGIRWYMGRSINQNPAVIEGLNKVLRNPVGVVYKLFYKDKPVSDQKLVGASLIFYGILFFCFKYGLRFLIGFLTTI